MERLEVLKARAVRETMAAQMTLQVLRAPVEVAQELLVPGPGEFLRTRRHSKQPCPVEMRCQSRVGRLCPQSVGQDANVPGCILSEE